jgi:ribosomal protein S18 acetylase RimI-like enzyme
MAFRYPSGEAIEKGDYVLWHGDPGVVEFVADDGGIMVNPPMVLEDPLCDDLDFVARKGIEPAPTIAHLTIADYDELIELLSATPGVVLRAADSRDATARYLERNPKLSFVARCDDRITGVVMSGHDGRRGYLQHLAVRQEARRQGIGSLLVAYCLTALRGLGIEKIHIDVLAGNEFAHRFWTAAGWQRRDDIIKYSFTNSSDSNA